jgi:putative nucleotidyltransferase with HDIG domain
MARKPKDRRHSLGKRAARAARRKQWREVKHLLAAAAFSGPEPTLAPERQNLLNGAVRALANAMACKDPYTAKHQRFVALIAAAIAQEMGYGPEFVEGVRVMGLLHDLGKIALPAEVLAKPGKLSQEEFDLVKTHPRTGHDILLAVAFPWPVALAVLQHHERLDGSGYPHGFSGDEIIPEARILAVADVVKAMAFRRPYRPARGLEAALGEISENQGRLYDPEAADACLKIMGDTAIEEVSGDGAGIYRAADLVGS